MHMTRSLQFNFGICTNMRADPWIDGPAGRLGCPSDRRLCANYTALNFERPLLSDFAAQK